MPSPQLASVSAPLPGGPARRPGLGQGRAGGAAAIRAGPRHVPGRRAGQGAGSAARGGGASERASERERMREKVRACAGSMCPCGGEGVATASGGEEESGGRGGVQGCARVRPAREHRRPGGEAPWSLC